MAKVKAILKPRGKSFSKRLQGYISSAEKVFEGKPKASRKPATVATVVFLVLIAIAQLLRVVFQVKLVANAMVIPIWGSIIACIVAGALAILLWRENM